MNNTALEMFTDHNLRELRGEVSVEWKIKDFINLPTEKEYFLDSSIFLLSDAQWFLRIYPNGNSTDEDTYDGWVSLFLKRKCSSSEEHNVAFSFRIKKSDGSTYKPANCEHKFVNGTGYGEVKFLKKSKFEYSKDIVSSDGSLTVLITTVLGNISDLKTCLSRMSISERGDILSNSLKNLLQSGRHVDTTFKVKDRDFQVHKSILAARSSVFDAMFHHDMVEKTRGVVNVEDCDPEVFQDFLLSLYSGEVDNVTSGNAPDLYKIADKYNLKDLKEECARCMSRELSTESFCDVVMIADQYGDVELMKNVTEYFTENWKIVVPTAKWLCFLAEYYLLANKLLIKLAEKD